MCMFAYNINVYMCMDACMYVNILIFMQTAFVLLTIVDFILILKSYIAGVLKHKVS